MGRRQPAIVGYVQGAVIEGGIDYDRGGMVVKSWDGDTLAYLRIRSSWRVDSWVNSRMYSYQGCDHIGRHYFGRGFGNGMLVRLYAYQ